MGMIKLDCKEILTIVRTMPRAEPPRVLDVPIVKTMEEYDEIQNTLATDQDIHDHYVKVLSKIGGANPKLCLQDCLLRYDKCDVIYYLNNQPK